MATPLTFEALWRDHGVARGLKTIADQVAKTKTGLDKLGTSTGVFKRLSASSAHASRAGMSIGTNLQRGIIKPMAGLPGIIAGLVGGAVVMGAKRLATEASDMNETVSKTRTIFGTSSKAIESWAKGAAKNLGMSRQEALTGASAFGNLFDQLGFGVKQATAMSKGFVQMATDAASFNNANPAEVMDAFQAATRGEFDALQKYIPTVSAATIEAEAMRMTHKKSKGDLTAADKAAALYQVSVKGLGKATGDFNRTSSGFANQQRIMAANWADLRVKIGTYFLPMFTKAAKYMNEEGFPALTRIVDVLGTIGGAAGRMGSAVLKVFSTTFATAIDGATTNLTEIADWMETHQETMIRFFIRLGQGAIGFGRGIVALAVSGIRSFGDMSGAMGETVRSVGNGIASLMEGAAQLLPPWSDARKDLLAGAKDIRIGANNAADGLANTKTKAHEAATAIANKTTPAFDAAADALAAVGDAEIWKAKQRDAAAAAAIAIRDIGTKADGSQIKLKTWNDRTKLGADAQRGLETRIKAARDKMIDQWKTGVTAGDKQKDLTKRWNDGKEALYREFKQMGLTNKEARTLANRYGAIPGKVKTKHETPGLTGPKGAIKNTEILDRKINDLNNKGVAINFSTNAGRIASSFGVKLSRARAPGTRNIPQGGPGRHSLDSMIGPPVADPEHSHAAGGPTVSRTVTTRTNQLNMRPVPAAFNRIGDDVAEGVGRQLGLVISKRLQAAVAASSGAPGGRVPIVAGRGWGAIQAAMRRHGARTFNTYPGHHPSMERARDVYPHNWAAANAARALSGVWYVIYRMRIASKNHGNVWRQYRPTNFRGDWRHERHIHVARYDRGGILKPGGVAANASGQPERVLSPPVTRTFGRMVRVMERGGAGNTYHVTINAPNYVGSREELRDAMLQMVRSNRFQVLTR